MLEFVSKWTLANLKKETLTMFKKVFFMNVVEVNPIILIVVFLTLRVLLLRLKIAGGFSN